MSEYNDDILPGWKRSIVHVHDMDGNLVWITARESGNVFLYEHPRVSATEISERGSIYYEKDLPDFSRRYQTLYDDEKLKGFHISNNK